MRGFLFASDLDGTLIPPPGGEDWSAAVRSIRALRGSTGVFFAYMTGRHLELALEGVRSQGLPDPDRYVCDVGTSLHRPQGEGWRPDEPYRSLVRERFGGHDAAEVVEVLGGLDGIRPQAPSKQAEFKASFIVEPGAADWRARVEEALERLGVPFHLVDSLDVAGEEVLLDVLPAGVSKGFALRHLQRELGFDRDRVVYAGDSGNDLDALLTGVRGILVGSAEAAVRDTLRRRLDSAGLAGRVHFARAPGAAGVVEGLRHFRCIEASGRG